MMGQTSNCSVIYHLCLYTEIPIYIWTDTPTSRYVSITIYIKPLISVLVLFLVSITEIPVISVTAGTQN